MIVHISNNTHPDKENILYLSRLSTVRQPELQ